VRDRRAPAHSRRIAEIEGLLNPGATSSMRLIAATLREVAAKEEQA
jgi:hypothetical protein